MKTIQWRVALKSAPTALRYCKKCGANALFMPSGLFRVNAQQRTLDVWLLYRCSGCEATWKLPLLSRVSPRAIPPELLAGFHSNDSGLALRYAADAALLKRHGAEMGTPEIEVFGEGLDLSIPTRLHIVPQYALEVKLSFFLRGQLGLSRSEYERLCAEKRISCIAGSDLKKGKLSGEIIVEIR